MVARGAFISDVLCVSVSEMGLLVSTACVRCHLQSAVPLYQSKVSSGVEKLGGSIELEHSS